MPAYHNGIEYNAIGAAGMIVQYPPHLGGLCSNLTIDNLIYFKRTSRDIRMSIIIAITLFVFITCFIITVKSWTINEGIGLSILIGLEICALVNVGTSYMYRRDFPRLDEREFAIYYDSENSTPLIKFSSKEEMETFFLTLSPRGIEALTKTDHLRAKHNILWMI